MATSGALFFHGRGLGSTCSLYRALAYWVSCRFATWAICLTGLLSDDSSGLTPRVEESDDPVPNW